MRTRFSARHLCVRAARKFNQARATEGGIFEATLDFEYFLGNIWVGLNLFLRFSYIGIV